MREKVNKKPQKETNPLFVLFRTLLTIYFLYKHPNLHCQFLKKLRRNQARSVYHPGAVIKNHTD